MMSQLKIIMSKLEFFMKSDFKDLFVLFLSMLFAFFNASKQAFFFILLSGTTSVENTACSSCTYYPSSL